MFSEIKDYCIKNDIAAFILSALATSRGVSEKYGLIPNIRHRETVCECRTEGETAELFLCSENEFKKMREKYLSGIPYSVAWPDYDMSYMFKELNYSGSILKMTFNGEEFYAVTETDGDSLLIKETNISQKLFQLLINSLSVYFSECNEIKIHIVRINLSSNHFQQIVRKLSSYLRSTYTYHRNTDRYCLLLDLTIYPIRILHIC